MKRLASLLLLPLASGALFAQGTYTITGTVPSTGTVGVSYPGASLTTSPQAYAAWSYTGSLPPGLSMTTGSSYAAAISGTPTTAGSYTFTVQANVGVGAPLVATRAYSIVIAGPQVPPVYITPSSLPNGTFGTTYSQVLTAYGGYGAGTYTFSLDPSSPGPQPDGLVISTTGPTTGAITGTPVTVGTFPFTVRVTSQTASGAAVYGTQSYTITIAGPPLVIGTTSLPAGTVGVPYSQPLSATGGTPPYTWQLTGGSLPPGLTLASSGNVSGTPTAASSFTFQVKVSDSQQASATGSFTIRITPAALVITTSSLPAGTVGTSYTATLAATGGTPPYTWSVASGALPSGLSISSAGVISGTPIAAGTFSVTLQATDSAQAIATKAYSVTVAAATVPLSITTQAPLAGGVVGVAYTQAFSATGGTAPYTWSVLAGAGFLPTGLTLSAAGSLTGTPALFAGDFPFTVQVADAAGRTATKAFTLTVAGVLSIATANPLPEATVGASYNFALDLVGGRAPFVWSIASGALPAGVSLNTSTGSLSGTPSAAGSFAFTVAVAAGGQNATKAFTLTVGVPLSITTPTPLPGGVAGVPYTQAFAATGGTSPYGWSVSTGALPTGLTLSGAGSLTGTPTAAGTFNFTIQLGDFAGRTATASFTITVTAGLTITTTLPDGTVGTAYSQTLAAAGGSGTLTWSVSTGALPDGITLNSSAGSLSGTPSAPGAFTFTVGVTGGGQTATKSFTITVGVPPRPPATITGLPATPAPATQPALGIGIPNAYPLAITGQVTLTFAPDSPSPDGQEVVFTTGGRIVNFTVPANTTQAVFSGVTPGVQTGTVSGTITLTLKLTAAGIDVTPSPAPSTKLTIAKNAPVILPQGVTVTPTSGGFNIVVVGYATSREMVSAAVTFTAAAGVTLAGGSSQATIPLATVFTTWYTNSASAAYGSNFSLTMPFTIANGTSTNSLTSVSVVLTNAQGSSASMSAAAH